MTPAPSDVTGLLAAWAAGDADALTALVPLVRDTLHRLARRQLRAERPGHTLQPTELLHEAYLRLVDQRQVPSFQDRAHFLGVCARIMREILVDHARRQNAVKRGGCASPLPLDEALVYAPDKSNELLAVDEALERLSQLDERKGRVVELRFFGGLNIPEAAVALGVSENTVLRDWAFARAWLQRELAIPA